jgi:hypothetical protein
MGVGDLAFLCLRQREKSVEAPRNRRPESSATILSRPSRLMPTTGLIPTLPSPRFVATFSQPSRHVLRERANYPFILRIPKSLSSLSATLTISARNCAVRVDTDRP